MLSSVCWVSKVAAKSIPVKYEITEAEAAAFLAESNAYIEENAMGLQQAKGTPFAAMGQRASNSDMEEEEDEEGNDKNDEHDKHAQSDHDPVVKKYQLDEYPSESEDDADMQDHGKQIASCIHLRTHLFPFSLTNSLACSFLDSHGKSIFSYERLDHGRPNWR